MEDIKLCPFCESPMLIVDDGKTIIAENDTVVLYRE